MMMRQAIALCVLCTGAALGQTAPKPEFEVASFKRGTCDQRPFEQESGATVTLRNMPMVVFLGIAYHVPFDRVSGPAWLNVECYDFLAKAAPDVNKETFPEVLRSLLEERVKLKAHLDRSPVPVYALVKGREEPKLQASAPDTKHQGRCTPQGKQLTCKYQHVTVAEFVEQFPHWMSRDWFDLPVVDLTGIEGFYDLTLTWTMSDRRPGSATEGADPGGIDFFDAIRDQLGLRLERRKAPVERLIVDSLERNPIEN